MAETIAAPSVLKNIDNSRIIEAKNKTKGSLMNCIKNPFRFGGDEGIRTPGLCVANASLYQLSHAPMHAQLLL